MYNVNTGKEMYSIHEMNSEFMYLMYNVTNKERWYMHSCALCSKKRWIYVFYVQCIQK